MAETSSQAAQRQRLRFTSLDDVIAHVAILTDHGYRQLGQWSLGQICDHLSRAMHGSIDGFDFSIPFHQRLLGRLIKHRLLKRGFPAGLPLKGAAAKALTPADISDADGVEALHNAVRRLKTDPTRQPSPVLGPLSDDEWTQFHCRHAELHLGHLLPGADDNTTH